MESDKPIAKPRARVALIIALLLALAALAASYYLTPARPPIDGVVARRSIAPRKAGDVIAQEGQLRFVYEGSIYTLRNDRSFTLERTGISGQTIVGKWTETSDGVYDIDGKWEWMNGKHPNDDFRTMTLTIRSVNGTATIDWRKEQVYTCDVEVGPSRKKPAP